jgi:hypothetical protein
MSSTKKILLSSVNNGPNFGLPSVVNAVKLITFASRPGASDRPKIATQIATKAAPAVARVHFGRDQARNPVLCEYPGAFARPPTIAI